MNNEREAVIVLSGMRQMRSELTDGSRRADVADRAFNREIQLEFHLGGDGLLFLQLVAGCNHSPAGWMAF